MYDIKSYKEPTIARTRVLWHEVVSCYKNILYGNMLVIDPSIGSAGKNGSLPGYAIFRAGILEDSGVIELPLKKSQHERLFELGRTLRDDFDSVWDVLVLENVPSMRMGQFNSAKMQVPLHMAVGAIHSSTLANHVVRIQPKQWHEVCAEDYVKSDANDAISMGVCVLKYARHMELLGSVPSKSTTGKRKAALARKKSPVAVPI